VTNDNFVFFSIHKTEQNTPTTKKHKAQHFNINFYLSTVHALYVSVVLSHYEFQTTTPFTDALLSIEDCGSLYDAWMMAGFSSSLVLSE